MDTATDQECKDVLRLSEYNEEQESATSRKQKNQNKKELNGGLSSEREKVESVLEQEASLIRSATTSKRE